MKNISQSSPIQDQCIYAGGGYRVYDSNKNYLGYLSVNMSEDAPYDFSITLVDANKHKSYWNFGHTTNGTFGGF